MKPKYFFITLLLGIFCLSLFTTSCNQSGASKTSKEVEVTFSVNMSCASCQREIENNLPAQKGVKELKVDLEKKEVWILYDSKMTTKSKLVKAFAELGYKATEKSSCC